MEVTVIGIDCAADEARMGLSLGALSAGGLRIARTTLGSAGESAMATVAAWIRAAERFVVAFDAPLGWPAALSKTLGPHRAGEPIAVPAHRLLRRRTEQAVADLSGRLPPEVGADRVARMALSALSALAQLRSVADRPVPLAWAQGQDSGAIEVHPPSTLRAHGVRVDGYRGTSSRARAARREVIDWLASALDLGVSYDLLMEDPHLLDAVVSALAAADFARGHCVAPEDPDLARQEGWIWVRGSPQRSLF